MKRVCFVTDELYPFTAGGIGRLIHNLIRTSADEGHEVVFHLLVPSTSTITTSNIAAVFGAKVEIHYANLREGWKPTFDEDGEVYPPAAAFTDCPEHSESLDFWLALRNLAQEGLRFDTIEFADFRGWAYCTLQAKRLRHDFPHGRVTVRLHGTDGIIQHYENKRPSPQRLALHELERKALLDADVVVAHLRPVVERYREFYGFDERWVGRVRVEFPPATLEAVPVPARRSEPDLVFVTKIQPLKRPDLFVRGAALFMRSHPDFVGRAIIACHTDDEDCWDAVESMIPPDLASRFPRVESPPARASLIPGNIVVIPSEYESLCLSAYEAASAGATLVLNGACPSFGAGTPFENAPGCLHFDGSAVSLARTLAVAWREQAPAAVAVPPDRPYWLDASAPRLEPAREQPTVSILVTNYNLGAYLPEALRSVAASSHARTEVILVDDASPSSFDRQLLEVVERDGSIRVIRNGVNLGLAASRNVALDAATGEYVLPLDADDCLAPRFLELAVGALERNRDFDVVVPQTAFFDSDEALLQQRFSDYALFLGDVASLGMVENRLSSATALVRRATALRFRYDEKLTAYEDWNLWLRMAAAGVRFLTTNSIQFFYRRRRGSMVRGVNRLRRLELMAQSLRSLKLPIVSGTHLFSLLIPAIGALEDPDGEGRSLHLRHQLVDRIDASLKRVPLVRPALRRLTLELTRIVSGNRVEG